MKALLINMLLGYLKPCMKIKSFFAGLMNPVTNNLNNLLIIHVMMSFLAPVDKKNNKIKNLLSCLSTGLENLIFIRNISNGITKLLVRDSNLHYCKGYARAPATLLSESFYKDYLTVTQYSKFWDRLHM